MDASGPCCGCYVSALNMLYMRTWLDRCEMLLMAMSSSLTTMFAWTAPHYCFSTTADHPNCPLPGVLDITNEQQSTCSYLSAREHRILYSRQPAACWRHAQECIKSASVCDYVPES